MAAAQDERTGTAEIDILDTEHSGKQLYRTHSVCADSVVLGAGPLALTTFHGDSNLYHTVGYLSVKNCLLFCYMGEKMHHQRRRRR